MGLLQGGGSVFQDPEIVNAFSGAIAGALTATFVCPLDVLKTRLQVQRISNTHRVGIVGGLTSIAKQEGIKSLYRGLTPTLMALLPNWAVYFTVYGRLKTTLTSRPGDRTVPATPAIHMAAAAGAGVATLLVTNPLWVIKTRLQTQHMPLSGSLTKASAVPYKGTLDAFVRIAREEGWRGMYSGLAPSMAGICHVAIQFPLYEAAKVHAANQRGVRPDELSASELVVTSAFSKMVASTITYPHEVIRSYMHVTGSGPFNGLGAAVGVIYREDGLRGFYRGCATNLLRTTPAAALTFTSFELIARALRRLSGAQQPEHAQAEADAELQQVQDGVGQLDAQQAEQLERALLPPVPEPPPPPQQQQQQVQQQQQQQQQQHFERLPQPQPRRLPWWGFGSGQQGGGLLLRSHAAQQQQQYMAQQAGACQLAAELQHIHSAAAGAAAPRGDS